MNCTNCGLKNEEMYQYCTNCGQKLQKELINKDINQKKTDKKNINKSLLIIIGVIIVIICLIIMFSTLKHNKEDWLTGTYNCGPIKKTTQTVVTMNFIVKEDKTFIMSYGRNIVSGKYQISKENYSRIYNLKKYELELTMNNRLLNGTIYNDEYSTNYELSIDNNNDAVLMNKKSMQIYYCKKNK